jgi:hypothetical protein
MKVWKAIFRILRELNDAGCIVYHPKAFKKRINAEFDMHAGVLYTVRKSHHYMVVSINKMSVQSIFERAKKLITFDNIYGLQETFSKMLVYERFLKLFGVKTKKMCQYEYTKDGKKKKRIENFEYADVLDKKKMSGQEKSEESIEKLGSPYEKLYYQSNKSNCSKFIHYKIFPMEIAAILTIDKCTYNNYYKKILREFFKKVRSKGIRYVAIDIRENCGGSYKIAKEFIKYLPCDQYDDYKTITRKVARLVSANTSNLARNEKYSDLTFNGQLYILTSPVTAKAAARFSVVLQDNGLAKVIGEPCGTKPSCYGGHAVFELPNSKLQLVITTKEFKRPNTSKDGEHFQKPDYQVPWFQAVNFFIKFARNDLKSD